MSTITLPARCDRAASEALLPEFVALIGNGPIAVDASGVTHVGQAMLQVLVSARRTAQGATISPSPALIDAAQIAGLCDELFDGDAA